MSPVSDALGRTTLFKVSEVNMDTTVNGKGVSASPGSETMACLTLGLCGNPGGPASSSRRGSMPDNRRGRKANEVQGVG